MPVVFVRSPYWLHDMPSWRHSFVPFHRLELEMAYLFVWIPKPRFNISQHSVLQVLQHRGNAEGECLYVQFWEKNLEITGCADCEFQHAGDITQIAWNIVKTCCSVYFYIGTNTKCCHVRNEKSHLGCICSYYVITRFAMAHLRTAQRCT